MQLETVSYLVLICLCSSRPPLYMSYGVRSRGRVAICDTRTFKDLSALLSGSIGKRTGHAEVYRYYHIWAIHLCCK
jgi:hypothetical protein